MSTAILPDRLARFLDPSFTLRLGKGSGVNGDTVDVCALQAADWLAGGDGKTDHSEGVCPVIGAFLRNLNDSHVFIDNRCELKMLVPKILGTNASWAVMAKRANVYDEFAVEYAKCAAEYVKCAAESAESAAKCVAELRKNCIAYVESMIAITD